MLSFPATKLLSPFLSRIEDFSLKFEHNLLCCSGSSVDRSCIGPESLVKKDSNFEWNNLVEYSCACIHIYPKIFSSFNSDKLSSSDVEGMLS